MPIKISKTVYECMYVINESGKRVGDRKKEFVVAENTPEAVFRMINALETETEKIGFVHTIPIGEIDDRGFLNFFR